MMMRNWIRRLFGNSQKATAPIKNARRPRPTFRPMTELLEDRLAPATISVTTNADSGAGSLRAAITTADTNGQPTNLIEFSGMTLGSTTITLLSALPNLTAANVTIDGTTAPGFAVGTGTPSLVINGAGIANLSGLHLTNAGDTVKGVSIVNCDFAGILIDGSGANLGGTATVQDCYLGITPGGTVTPNFDGVAILDSASNTIGGAKGSLISNVISGNTNGNVLIAADFGSTSQHNAVEGNFIGTNATGGVLSTNTAFEGVLLQGSTDHGVKNNTIGGSTTGSTLGNVISGNGSGVVAFQANNNLIEGNIIGLTFGGLVDGNTGDGVVLDLANSNQVGGFTPDVANTISGNFGRGITITGDSSTVVTTAASGSVTSISVASTAGFPANQGGTITISTPAGVAEASFTYTGSDDTTFTGASQPLTNPIHVGDIVTSSSDAPSSLNAIFSNFIGTNLAQSLTTSGFGNGLEGIYITNGANGTEIGGSAAGEGNTIAFNSRAGVLVGIDTSNGVAVGANGTKASPAPVFAQSTLTTAGVVLPVTPTNTGVISVVSTNGFASSGTLTVQTTTGTTVVTYSGISGNSFTGVTGGSGTVVSGATVSQLSPNVNDISGGANNAILGNVITHTGGILLNNIGNALVPANGPQQAPIITNVIPAAVSLAGGGANNSTINFSLANTDVAGNFYRLEFFANDTTSNDRNDPEGQRLIGVLIVQGNGGTVTGSFTPLSAIIANPQGITCTATSHVISGNPGVNSNTSQFSNPAPAFSDNFLGTGPAASKVATPVSMTSPFSLQVNSVAGFTSPTGQLAVLFNTSTTATGNGFVIVSYNGITAGLNTFMNCNVVSNNTGVATPFASVGQSVFQCTSVTAAASVPTATVTSFVANSSITATVAAGSAAFATGAGQLRLEFALGGSLLVNYTSSATVTNTVTFSGVSSTAGLSNGDRAQQPITLSVADSSSFSATGGQLAIKDATAVELFNYTGTGAGTLTGVTGGKFGFASIPATTATVASVVLSNMSPNWIVPDNDSVFPGPVVPSGTPGTVQGLAFNPTAKIQSQIIEDLELVNGFIFDNMAVSADVNAHIPSALVPVPSGVNPVNLVGVVARQQAPNQVDGNGHNISGDMYAMMVENKVDTFTDFSIVTILRLSSTAGSQSNNFGWTQITQSTVTLPSTGHIEFDVQNIGGGNVLLTGLFNGVQVAQGVDGPNSPQGVNGAFGLTGGSSRGPITNTGNVGFFGQGTSLLVSNFAVRELITSTFSPTLPFTAAFNNGPNANSATATTELGNAWIDVLKSGGFQLLGDQAVSLSSPAFQFAASGLAGITTGLPVLQADVDASNTASGALAAGLFARAQLPTAATQAGDAYAALLTNWGVAEIVYFHGSTNTFSVLGSVTVGVNKGTLGFSITGTLAAPVLNLSLNGSQLLSITPTGNNIIGSAGEQGVFGWGANAVVDNFSLQATS
jgi:hypothetical protein